MHTSKVALDKKIVSVVKLGKRVSGRDFGQTPPRLLPYLRFGLDTNELFRRKEGLMTLS